MSPIVEKMEIFPVAGTDCMELNLSGAHAPYFTRNIVILTDSNGVEGVGEVPGGQKITAALESVKDLVVGTRIVDYKQTLNKVRAWLNANIKDDCFVPEDHIVGKPIFIWWSHSPDHPGFSGIRWNRLKKTYRSWRDSGMTAIKKNYSLCLIPGIISPTVSTLLTGCTIRK